MEEMKDVVESETKETYQPNFKIFDTTIEITVKNKLFRFNIPTVRQTAKIGQRARSLRIKDGSDDGNETGLSFYEMSLYRAMANIEELLIFSEDPDFFSSDAMGKPVVDSERWPLTVSEDYILEVYDGLLAAVNSFRERGSK